ncbi:MAG: hypothetical protein CTR53_05125 [Ferrovibrio sp.]|nr:MAG: hypothetical protein CTR53_05125 [Ferrovibrio sp.]
MLFAVWDMIGEMVNYARFVKGDLVEDVQLIFNTEAHSRVFIILLGDFLSRPQPSRKRGIPFNLPSPPDLDQVANSYLFYLRQICSNPLLGFDASGLTKAVDQFWAWLDGESLVEKVWFPELQLEADLNVKRISYLKICANISKHNFSRLQDNVRKIQDILAASGNPVGEQEGYQSINAFYEWFYRHVFSYHTSTLAEFLNEIRWAIFEYLQPVYRGCLRQESGEIAYTYVVPPEIEQPLAKAMFWDLMNAVRTPPYFRRFSATEVLKRRY